MALIKYRQNGKWVTLDIEATSIGSAVKIDASQIIISNINASASGNVNNGDTTTEAISKLINQIKALQNKTVDLSGYYTKTETDSKYVVKVNGKSLSTNDYTTAEKTKLNSLNNYTLPAASADTLGGVKVGTGLAINSSGVLSASVNIPLFTEAEIDACFAAAKATLADADDSTY